MIEVSPSLSAAAATMLALFNDLFDLDAAPGASAAHPTALTLERRR